MIPTAVVSKNCKDAVDCGGSDIRYHACIDGKCDECSVDDECDRSSGDVCNNGFCGLSNFFEPFTILDLICTLTIFIGAMIAAGGGLGGGGIFIPTYVLILSLGTSSAAALSQATIFGGSIVNLIMNFKQNHPIREHRPLPDLWLILIFEPMLLGGTIIGVIFNVILPQPITLACLVITLSYAAIRTLNKGVKLWQKETELQRLKLEETANEIVNDAATENLNSVDPNDVSIEPNNNSKNHPNPEQISQPNTDSIPSSHPSNKTTSNEMDTIVYTDTNNKNNYNNNLTDRDTPNMPDIPHIAEQTDHTDSTVDLLKSQSKNETNEMKTEDLDDKKIKYLLEACGMKKSELNKADTKSKLQQLEPFIEDETKIKKPMLLIFFMWSVLALFSILRANVEGCSIIYWIITFFVFPFLFLLTFILSKRQVLSYQKKLELGWIKCEGDVEWKNYRQALIYACVAGIAGILGGLLGIGGGMIVSPLLLELGVLPRIASATSAMAVLVTSSSATLQFLLIDMLSYDYMLWFMSVGIIGTYFGQTLVDGCIKKYGRNSVVIFAVGTVIGLAVISMGINGIVDIVNGDSPLVFSNLC